MSVAAAGASQSAQEYKIQGGVIFCDKTAGVAKVAFSQRMTNLYRASTYEITINGKKLLSPISEDERSFLLAGSVRLTISIEGTLFKIVEVDPSGENTFYVDAENEKPEGYYTYYYIPQTIPEEEAKRKYSHLAEEVPNFTYDLVAYNRHGVVVFGKDDGYVCYYAKPGDEKVAKIDCGDIGRYRDGGSSFAVTKNGLMAFKYTYSTGEFRINLEEATGFKIKN